jgi:serine/threonine protein kinase
LIDPNRAARFRHEAQVLASLNHPSIAQIHGLDEDSGNTTLVMELVTGEWCESRPATPFGSAIPKHCSLSSRPPRR